MAQFTSAYDGQGNFVDINTELSPIGHRQLFCIGCGAEVIPKQGEIREWHFAHKSALETKCTAEHCLHFESKKRLYKILKEMIESKSLRLPGTIQYFCEFEAINTLRDECERTKTTVYEAFEKFDSIELGWELSNKLWAPNVYVVCNNERLLFETTINTRNTETLKQYPTIEFDVTGPKDIDLCYWDHLLKFCLMHNCRTSSRRECSCASKRVIVKAQDMHNQVCAKEWDSLSAALNHYSKNGRILSYREMRNSCANCLRYIVGRKTAFECSITNDSIAEPEDFVCGNWKLNTRAAKYSYKRPSNPSETIN